MAKQKKVSIENYLEYIPVKSETINWSSDENGNVTLELENKGLFNKIAQKIFRRPKVTYIHLEEMGSFIWPCINGENNLIVIGEEVKEHFGEKAEPLYERLAKYINMLEKYGFVVMRRL